jgi:hypothetical protein
VSRDEGEGRRREDWHERGSTKKKLFASHHIDYEEWKKPYLGGREESGKGEHTKIGGDSSGDEVHSWRIEIVVREREGREEERFSKPPTAAVARIASSNPAKPKIVEE